MSDPKVSFSIAAFVAAATAVDPNGIIRLSDKFYIFLIKGNSTFSNVPASLLKLSPDCPILDN